MALIACYECGAGISHRASACPQCGAPPGIAPLTKKEVLYRKYRIYMWSLFCLILISAPFWILNEVINNNAFSSVFSLGYSILTSYFFIGYCYYYYKWESENRASKLEQKAPVGVRLIQEPKRQTEALVELKGLKK